MNSKDSLFKNNKLIFAGLFVLALILRLVMIDLDPFLHDWDERVHALVARNMMHHPLTPMLNQEFLSSFDYKDWVSNEIWIHKQPLFLWQIALSFKLFGVSEFTLRLPSAIMGALSCPMIYRIALIAFKNKRIALLTGLLCCLSYYQLELITGVIGMEHNDLAFSFYVLASIWAFYEFTQKNSWRWTIAVGLFVGCAILNKWLTGLIVFLPWGIFIIREFVKTKRLSQVKYFTAAIITCCLVFLPWQLYILYKFPAEAAHEFWLNSQHIITAVDGHAGSWYYYFLQLPRYFGEYMLLLIPIGLFALRKKMNDLHLANLIMGVVVFAFFRF